MNKKLNQSFNAADPVFCKDLLKNSKDALTIINKLLEEAININKANFIENGRVNATLFNEPSLQRIAHGISWLKTYSETLQSAVECIETLQEQYTLSQHELLLLQTLMHEYISDVFGGINASGTETFTLGRLGLNKEDIRKYEDKASISYFLDNDFHLAAKAALTRSLIECIEKGDDLLGNRGINKELSNLASEIQEFVKNEIKPISQQLHIDDGLIPQEIINEMANIGVFGLTIPKRYGGSEMGTLAMALSTEELAKGSLAAGSLPTRSEIMAELLLVGGTKTQKNDLLPKLAKGDILPTISLTEPNAGSDLAGLSATATKIADGSYIVDGTKLWNGHAARANRIVLLARTNPESEGSKGISMFLLPKEPGTFEQPSINSGLNGHRIKMPGYRGMGAYELHFDGFKAPKDSLLGDQEGAGFKHMMQAFEPARIQTAARAVGVAQSALEESLDYASNRIQSGKSIINFDRIGDKIARMAAEIFAVRQLTYKAAIKKEAGQRSDMEAATAKMLSPRIAFDAASDAVQIFGGEGYKLENDVSRIFADAKVLNIFEGASEVQASIIARRIMEYTLE